MKVVGAFEAKKAEPLARLVGQDKEVPITPRGKAVARLMAARAASAELSLSS
jgi:hypothetical protein